MPNLGDTEWNWWDPVRLQEAHQASDREVEQSFTVLLMQTDTLTGTDLDPEAAGAQICKKLHEAQASKLMR